MISLFKLLKKQGISVGENMKPEDMITILSSVPSILSHFPAVSSAVNTLQSILNTYNSAKDTLNQAIDYAEKMEKALQTAQKLYDTSMSMSPGVYMVTAPGLGVPTPTMPSASSGFMAALNIGYTNLELAKEELKKAQDKVEQIENQLKDKVSSIVKLVFTSKV